MNTTFFIFYSTLADTMSVHDKDVIDNIFPRILLLMTRKHIIVATMSATTTTAQANIAAATTQQQCQRYFQSLQQLPIAILVMTIECFRVKHCTTIWLHELPETEQCFETCLAAVQRYPYELRYVKIKPAKYAWPPFVKMDGC